MIIFCEENQGVFEIGIKKEDMNLLNPSIYYNLFNQKNWIKLEFNLNEFFIAIFDYQASLC